MVGYDGSNAATQALELAKVHAQALGAQNTVAKSVLETKNLKYPDIESAGVVKKLISAAVLCLLLITSVGQPKAFAKSENQLFSAVQKQIEQLVIFPEKILH